MNATATAERPRASQFAGPYDRPNDRMRAHAARCREPRCRDTWERAVLVAAVELDACPTIRRTDSAIAARLHCDRVVAESIRYGLESRRLLARPRDPAAAPANTFDAAEREALALERREVEVRKADVLAEAFPAAAFVHPILNDEARPFDYRRPAAAPSPLDELNRLRELNRREVRRYLAEWRTIMGRKAVA